MNVVDAIAETAQNWLAPESRWRKRAIAEAPEQTEPGAAAYRRPANRVWTRRSRECTFWSTFRARRLA